MKLSIVTTLYYSAPHIEEFCRRITAVAHSVAGDDYEIIMVNDGSPDNSLAIALQLAAQDPHLVVVDLSRNFGHHKAVLAGLREACGEKIFLIDCDLEEEPELLASFYETMLREKVDLVYGVQEKRKGGWFERWSGVLYYRIFNYLSDMPLVHNQLMARLMTRQFAEALVSFPERKIFLGGLFVLSGFTQLAFLCVKHSKGSTTYSLAKKAEQAIDAITSFSAKPLYLIFYLGICIFFFSSILLTFFVIRTIVWGNVLLGWTSTIVMLLMLFGIIMMSIGILGIYLSKIFEEVKTRPHVIVRKVWRDKDVAMRI